MEKLETLKNGYKVLQDTERFQFGIDAVLLADFAASSAQAGKGSQTGCSLRPDEKVIDLGTGTGIIPLLMASRVKSLTADISATGCSAGVSFTGLEVQKDSAEMAARSVALNGLDDQIRIVNGDLREVAGLFGRHSFNVVTCNPPYMIDAHGRANELDAMTIARHEVLCTLEDVVAAADYLLAPHGRFFMIHRPFRLPEIFESLAKHKMEAKRMRLIHPFSDKEPNMVMIEARKNAKRRLTIEPPLVVRNKNGEYTEEINAIYNR